MLTDLSLQLKLLQKASVWIGLVFPVETLRSKLWPPSQAPTRPRLQVRRRRGKLQYLLLSVTPTSIQNFLGYLPTDWGHSNVSKGKGWGFLAHLPGGFAAGKNTGFLQGAGKSAVFVWVW